MSTKRQLSALDYEYRRDVKIPSDLFLGLKWKDNEGKKIETKLNSNNIYKGKRVAILKLSSYVGTVAIGAMHYYGRIEVHTSAFYEGGGWIGGFMGKNAPEFKSSLSIHVTRRLTKVEKDWGGDVIGRVGEYTYRFNREEDVLPHALKTFKRKFKPGWVLVPESWENGERPVLCET